MSLVADYAIPEATNRPTVPEPGDKATCKDLLTTDSILDHQSTKAIDHPQNGGAGSKEVDSKGAASTLNNLNTANECKDVGLPVIPVGENDESPQPNENSKEEAFLKTMLNYFSHDANMNIQLLSQLLLLIPDNRPDKPSQLNNLAIAYQDRFSRSGEIKDIEASIGCLNNVLKLLPHGHLGYPTSANNLGCAYRGRYERLGEIEDLQKAAFYQEQAISLTSDNNAEKPSWLNNIGNTYQRRFERLDGLEDLKKAIDSKSQAVELTPDDHPRKPTFLCNLGSILKSRFERLGNIADIDRAIEYQTQAVNLTPDSNEDKALFLNNLGISFQRRSEHLGKAEDLENAIACQVKVISLTSEDHADRLVWLSNLGILYQLRYTAIGNVEDLSRGINHQIEALSLCPDNHYRRPSIDLNLGNSLYRRFTRFGAIADIDKAIEHLNLAVSTLPRGHSDLPIWINNLGGFYTSRFTLFGESSDLRRARDCSIHALSLIPDDHPQKPQVLRHLAHTYQAEENPLLIDLAIGCLTRAISLIPDSHISRPSYIQHLGSAHYARYKISEEANDLDEAIRHQASSLGLVSDTFADKAWWFINLGRSYHCRFDISGNLDDLNNSIAQYNAVILSTPDDNSYRSESYYYLACAYEARSIKCNNQDDLTASIELYQQAAYPATQGWASYITFLAARKWAKLSSLHKLPIAQVAYGRAMGLIPQLLWVGTTITQRYGYLRTMGDLALEEVSHAISLRSFDLALQWLEQGRSIVWNQILQLRTPFNTLKSLDAELANELQIIGNYLESAGSRSTILVSSVGEMLDYKQDAHRHRELASKWDQLITRTRSIPGFEDFLRPKSKAMLMDAAKSGPVVIINVGETQGDALFLSPNSSEIRHLPLAGISRSKAVSLRSQFYPLLQDYALLSRGARGIKRAGYDPRAMFEKLLATLWAEVVGPILNFLGVKEIIPDRELPHITWCTTGELAGFPLHAAGLYDGTHPDAFDLVVSSYTPTISALLTSSTDSSRVTSGILGVGQENTPGFSRISNTIVELANIREKSQGVSIPYLELKDDKATIDAVLSGMEQCDWVHFACHASQKVDDPTNSAFHLYDGSLKLFEITQRAFKNKGLAFLSACQTATGAADLPDEAVHLAAGLLIAGYSGVIATLWSVYDEDAPEVSRDVYTSLLTRGVLDHLQASRALHGAVLKLRAKVGCKNFERWASFVHFGV
ncbi:unnamed protein product [Rhizoctonia solani]|uniref:CHAT domain-containing protein n=1 Tax=Rhizoctonia solani TaxID=456999 RepID=A0A8H3BRW8_9AGAM|nr:unnamed protein product [Rhizoctonia solani]